MHNPEVDTEKEVLDGNQAADEKTEKETTPDTQVRTNEKPPTQVGTDEAPAL